MWINAETPQMLTLLCQEPLVKWGGRRTGHDNTKGVCGWSRNHLIEIFRVTGRSAQFQILISYLVHYGFSVCLSGLCLNKIISVSNVLPGSQFQLQVLFWLTVPTLSMLFKCISSRNKKLQMTVNTQKGQKVLG